MKRAALFSLLIALGLGACAESPSSQRGRLLDENGEVLLELDLTVLETEYERAEGLRLHGPLAQGEALLLVFPREGEACISNRGVPFPIDLAYLNARREVIATETEIPAGAPGPYCHPGTQLALELPGGQLDPSFQLLEIGALLAAP